MKLEILRNSTDEESTIIQQQLKIIEQLKEKQEDISSQGSYVESVKVLPSLEAVPDYSLTYYRLQREYTVQNLIYGHLSQQYEQLKLNEAKDTPSLQFIDLPRIPNKRTAPLRSLIVIAIVGLGMFFAILFILVRRIFWNEFVKTLTTIIKKPTK